MRTVVSLFMLVLAGCSQRIEVLADEPGGMTAVPPRNPPPKPVRDAGPLRDPDDSLASTDAAVIDSPCGDCGLNALCAVDACVDASGIMSLDAWLSHTCEVERGQLFCWGRGELGQLGGGDRSSQNTRMRVGAFNDWLLVATGEHSTCALRAPGKLYCFGDNSSGQLAQGDTQARLLPTEAKTDLLFRALSCGGAACCAIDAHGALYCWGGNLEGMLGQDDHFGSADSSVPLAVMPGKSWRSVELGQGQVCAIADDGALYCWGRNPEGETGLGSELPQIRIPTRVGIESDWVSIAASQHHSCGVRGDGTLWCWGKNPYLEIGAADATRSFLIPTQVGTDVDWAEVGAGWFHGCALKRDGRLSCWGRAIEGQLGQGGGNPVRVPTRVAMPMQWQRIALGGFDTCGVDDTGSLYCWGAGPDGELGLGDVLRISEPVRVR